MGELDRRRMATNLRKWDESVPLHVAAPSYDVPGFLRGNSSLEPIEVRELGPVRGLDLLHLQCHFGMDTLSWAREGARVTGVDFSPAAIRAARDLTKRSHLSAKWVVSNIYDLPRAFDGSFDVVYTAKGATCWLPDLRPWAAIVARCLRPGGRFYLLEDHPTSEIFPNDLGTTRLELGGRYFGEAPVRDVTEGTYATSHRMRNRVSYLWIHPMSVMLNALIEAGLHIEAIHEFEYTYWRRYTFMHQDEAGYWHLDQDEGKVPLMWSVLARRPPAPSDPPPARHGRGDPRPAASRGRRRR